MEENYTARFRADISDLKANITTANLKMKEINAQYKAAASAAELAGDKQGKLAAEMKSLRDTIDVLESKLSNYKTQLQKTEDYVEKMRQEEARLQTELEQSKKEYGETSKEVKNYEKQLNTCRNSIRNAENNMSRLRTAADNTQAELNQARTSLNNLGNGARTAGQRVQTLSTNLTAINTAMSGLHSVVDGLTNRLVNLAANGLRVAANAMKEVVTSTFEVGASFEKSLSTAQATMMADASDMEQLKALAQELGATTVKSAKDVADSYNYMAQAGWKTEEMLAATADMINLSIASGEDMAMVTDIVTDALTAFGMEATDASRFCDILAAAAASSNTNVEKMGESFKYAAPLAGAMGYSAEDTALALGLMANAGIKASQAGTSLRKIFSQALANTDGIDLGTVHVDTVNADGSLRDLKTVLDELRQAMNGLSEAEQEALTGDLKQAAEELNVALEDENGKLKTTAQLAADVAEAMDGLSASEQIAFADTNAGKTAMAGLLSILNASEESYDSLAESIYNSAGACEKMAEIAGDNLSGSLTGLESRIESVQIALYDKLQKPVRSVVNTVADKFGELANSMTGGELSPMLDRITTSLGKLADKVAPIIDANGPALVALFDKFTVSIASVIDSLPGLVDDSLPKLIDLFDGLLDAAPGFVENTLPKLVDGFIWIVENGGSLLSTLIGLKVALTGISAVSGIASIVNTVTTLFGAGGALAGAGTAISGAFSTLGTTLAGVGSAIVAAVGWPALIVAAFAAGFAILYAKCDGFREFINGIGEKIGAFFTGVGEKISNFFANFSMDDVKEAFTDATAAVGNFFSEFATSAKEKFTGAVDKVKAKAGEIKDSVGQKFDSAKTTVGGFIDQVKGISLEDVGFAIGKLAGTTVNTMKEAKENVTTYFDELPGKVEAKFNQIVTNVTTWGSNLKQTAEEKARSVIEGVTTYFDELPGKVKAKFDQIVADVTAWGNDVKQKAEEKVSSMYNSVVDFFSQLPGKILAKLTEAKERITSSFEEWKITAGNKIREFVNSITSGLSDLPNKMLQAGRDAITGFVNGIMQKWNDGVQTVKNFASAVISGYKQVTQTNSPSKVFETLAGWIPVGAANGIKKKTKTAVDAVEVMAEQMFKSFNVSGLSEKIQAVRGTVMATAGTYTNHIAQSTVNNTTNTETHNSESKNVTYAPTFNYNKPLNAKETYRQNKNMLNAILGVN